eukprot:2617931-Pyramimonas_sp.AAC.1
MYADCFEPRGGWAGEAEITGHMIPYGNGDKLDYFSVERTAYVARTIARASRALTVGLAGS